MKESEEIIYIESDEEITSVVDRLHKAQGKELVLVVPRGAVVAQSLVNLKLLQREASNAKKTLGVVTQDAVARKIISQAGIPILDSIKNKRVVIEPKSKTIEAIPDEVDLTIKQKPAVAVHHFQDDDDGDKEIKEVEETEEMDADDSTFSHHDVDVSPRVTEHEPLPRVAAAPGGRKRSTKAFIVAVTIAVLVLIGGAIGLPSADVKLFVSGESYERDLEIQVATSEKVPSVEQALVPGDFVEDEVQVSDNFKASGTKNIGEKAKGTATISNDSGVDQTLSAGAKLAGNGLVFITDADVSVPKASLNAAGDKVVGKATVAVTADQAGDKYNVSGLAVSVNKDKLSGKIESATGGSTREVIIVAAQDIAAAKALLEKKAQDELKTKLADRSKKVIMDGAVKYDILESSTSVAEGTEATEFEMKLKQKGKALVFDEAIFRETYINILRRGLPDDKDLVFSASDEIVTQVGDSDFTNGKMTVKGAIKTQIVPKFETGIIKKDLVAESPEQVEEALKGLDHVKNVEVSISPPWFKRMPLVAARIKVSIEHE